MEELRDFDFGLDGLSPNDIVQLLRGRHYFFLDEIINSPYESKQQLAPVLLYLQTLLSFFLRFLQHADFTQMSTNCYASPMAALCCSFAELMEAVQVGLGVSQDGETFRKENAQWMDLERMRQEQREWVENELLPTLSQLKGETLPAVFIFALFNFLLMLLRKGRTEESEPLSVICNDLYAHLLVALRTAPPDLKEVENFSQYADNLFTVIHRAHPDALPHESPTTQRLDEEEEAKSAPMETLTREKFIKRQKLEYKLVAAEYFYRCGKMEMFVREVNQSGAEIMKELDLLTVKEAADPTRWSPVITPYIIGLQQRNFIIKLMDPTITMDLLNISRQAISKIFRAIPHECLSIALQNRRFSVIRALFSSKTMKEEELLVWLS